MSRHAGSGSRGGSVRPTREEFRVLARTHAVVPVVTELDADWWTPVGVFHLLAARERHAFLLESVEGGERLGRYSFVGRAPYRIVRGRGGRLTEESADGAILAVHGENPLGALGEILRRHRAPRLPGLPPFATGAVGYFGYDTVRWVERLPRAIEEEAIEDDLFLLFLRDVLAFDHVRRRLSVIANAVPAEDGGPDAAFDGAVARLDATVEALHRPLVPPVAAPAAGAGMSPVSVPDREDFCAMVERAKGWIRAGDIFQVVLSRRFTVPSPADDLSLYRSLRAVNPSPYMFLLRLGGMSAVGSSPEPLLKVRDGRLTYRPIAGTMPRSGDDEEDDRRAERLLADPKERAEHVMLVDLGRNDLGRCAVTGSVSVDELMAVEKYSHVMHIVSGLSARLRPGLEPLDALYACFPAGTVSGAPKVRAMEIIEALEPLRRGLYAGAVGYVDFTGNLDTCIALRTMIVRDGTITVQAGAGIVADSDPGREFEETAHKARALLEAVARIGGGDR